MLLSRTGKISGGIVAIGTVVVLAASPALAAGWAIVPVPPTGVNASLTGVTTTSDSGAWAVGSSNAELNGVGAKPLIDQWNGTAWSRVTAPATPGFNTASLAAVSASSSTDAWAIGRQQNNREDFTPLAMHWNGTAWTVSPSAATALGGQIGIGVADISPTDAYAIGGGLGSATTGLVAQWNGTTWTRLTVPQPSNDGLASDFDAISASGPDNVWIVGTYEDEISSTDIQNATYSLHWNGTAWSIVRMPVNPGTSPNDFYLFDAIQANSPTDVWAVGDQGVVDGSSSTLIEHFNGTAWSIVPSPSPGEDGNLNGVTTSNATNDVWAVGGDVNSSTGQVQTLTLNWNGTSWVTVSSPNVAGTNSLLTSVATTPGASIVQAVGYSGVAGSQNPLSEQNG